MTNTVDVNALFSGAPVSITVGGVECGSTTGKPKFALEVESGAPDLTIAGGPVRGTRRNRKIIPSLELPLNEMTIQKIGWAMPGCTALSSESVGQVRAGLATTLGADPALGATLIRLTSVTTVVDGDFIRIGAAGVAATEANSEILRVVTAGTAGATDTVVENSAGGGCLLDHANGAEAKTVTGTLLDAPAPAGATNIKVADVTALAPGDYIRIGYVGHYETRLLTAVGTTGPAGTGLDFAIPLTRDHALDEWVIEVTAAGSTIIRPTIGLVADAAYATVAVTDIGADGRQLVVTIENALSAESQSMEFDDDPKNPLALVLKFTGHYAAATPTVVPCTIELIDA